MTLLLGALGDLENIRVDTESSDGSTGTSTLDDQGAGEALGGECDDVVTALQRGEGVASRVSICCIGRVTESLIHGVHCGQTRGKKRSRIRKITKEHLKNHLTKSSRRSILPSSFFLMLLFFLF